MLKFDYEKSCKLDENIIYRLSNLLTNQRQNGFYLEKPQLDLLNSNSIMELLNLPLPEDLNQKLQYCVQERQIILLLFSKVNEERKLLREENYKLMERLAEFETEDLSLTDRDFSAFKSRIFGLHHELYKKFLKKERKKNDINEETVLNLKNKIAKMKQKIAAEESSRNLRFSKNKIREKLNPKELPERGLYWPYATIHGERNLEEQVKKNERERKQTDFSSGRNAQKGNSNSKKKGTKGKKPRISDRTKEREKYDKLFSPILKSSRTKSFNPGNNQPNTNNSNPIVKSRESEETAILEDSDSSQPPKQDHPIKGTGNEFEEKSKSSEKKLRDKTNEHASSVHRPQLSEDLKEKIKEKEVSSVLFIDENGEIDDIDLLNVRHMLDDAIDSNYNSTNPHNNSNDLHHSTIHNVTQNSESPQHQVKHNQNQNENDPQFNEHERADFQSSSRKKVVENEENVNIGDAEIDSESKITRFHSFGKNEFIASVEENMNTQKWNEENKQDAIQEEEIMNEIQENIQYFSKEAVNLPSHQIGELEQIDETDEFEGRREDETSNMEDYPTEDETFTREKAKNSEEDNYFVVKKSSPSDQSKTYSVNFKGKNLKVLKIDSPKSKKIIILPKINSKKEIEAQIVKKVDFQIKEFLQNSLVGITSQNENKRDGNNKDLADVENKYKYYINPNAPKITNHSQKKLTPQFGNKHHPTNHKFIFP